MTIASKLQKILEIKNNIKQALINKGVEVSNNFENFAEKIESIQGGEPNNLPAEIAGLCVWLDAEINSRAGVHDESVNGMQNLVYTPLIKKTTTVGCLEKLNGTATFGDKSCKLGGTMFVPCYHQTAFTFEFMGHFDSNVFNNVITQQLLLNNITGGGYQIMFTPTALHYQAYNSSSTRVKKLQYSTDIEVGKTYHIVITDVLGSKGSTKLYIDGEQVEITMETDNTGAVCPSGTIRNMGIMGVNSTSTTSVFPVSSNGQGAFYGEYTHINTLRLWSRVLSADEIKQNYIADKRRFG